MFTVEQYRAKTIEYSKLVRAAGNPNELNEFQKLERSYAELADNAQWVIDNHDNTLHGARRTNEQASNWLRNAKERLVRLMHGDLWRVAS